VTIDWVLSLVWRMCDQAVSAWKNLVLGLDQMLSLCNFGSVKSEDYSG
jgi:hypothetical protein